MASRAKTSTPYRTVGKTQDGVEVLAPKIKSKTFTAAQVRRAVEKALQEVAGESDKKPLRESDALRIQQRDDGRFEVRKPGAKRASAVTDTQSEAVERAKELAPGKTDGIHDISRTEADGDPPLPRFNMPLELGAFLGAKRFGIDDHKRKRALVLDREQHRYQRLVSDIAGQDIRCHHGEPGQAIQQVATWLRVQSPSAGVPGGMAIAAEFEQFLRDHLPAVLVTLQLQEDEMTFTDYVTIVAQYAAEL